MSGSCPHVVSCRVHVADKVHIINYCYDTAAAADPQVLPLGRSHANGKEA